MPLPQGRDVKEGTTQGFVLPETLHVYQALAKCRKTFDELSQALRMMAQALQDFQNMRTVIDMQGETEDLFRGEVKG